MAAQLSVNLNAVAMLRNRRNLPWPSLLHLGGLALDAGAHGLTVHPRPDQRHIRFTDLQPLRELTARRGVELNIEGYPTPQFMELVSQNRPDQVTLVPDDPSQSTSDHGWDCIAHRDFLKSIVARLHQVVPRVSLFCDPDATEQQLEAAQDVGANRIELYTGPYGVTYDNAEAARSELSLLVRTAGFASQQGLGVNAGHDLTVDNLPPLVAAVPNLLEVSIGHALTADALEFGMTETVQRFMAACSGSQSRS
ncbi:MAG: pyridoxine 5'-phosphate synthase [Pirellulaceae bacterium]|nr:pyridoxine 5'-phosphate synthase [Pirellulaceae bacterium]